MTLFIIFTLGYAVGGVSALLLISLTLAGRERERVARRELIGHDI